MVITIMMLFYVSFFEMGRLVLKTLESTERIYVKLLIANYKKTTQ